MWGPNKTKKIFNLLSADDILFISLSSFFSQVNKMTFHMNHLLGR